VTRVKGRPRNEEIRKIFCEVVQGVTYSDRCLLKLCKVIEDNKTCSRCILYQFEKMESAKIKRSDIKDIKKIKDMKKGRRRIKASPWEKPNPIRNEDTIKTYSSQDLIELLGKSERTIREWAQKGKIPARKVGKEWRFPKEEFDRWLSEKGHLADIVPTVDGHSNDVVMTTNTASQGEDVAPLDQNNEGSP
jgi:excisionase family DNA binding protein